MQDLNARDCSQIPDRDSVGGVINRRINDPAVIYRRFRVEVETVYEDDLVKVQAGPIGKPLRGSPWILLMQ